MYGADVYEVGVHIADVSYFVKAGTALDEVASNRATSVYLVQRVSPNLCVNMCMYVPCGSVCMMFVFVLCR